MPEMPFGRHKGKPLAELPDDYLTWSLRVTTSPSLRDALLAEQRARRCRSASSNGDGPRKSVDSSSPPALRELVERSRRELARQHHPDMGGSTEVMKGINLLADRLLNRNGRSR